MCVGGVQTAGSGSALSGFLLIDGVLEAVARAGWWRALGSARGAPERELKVLIVTGFGVS